MIKPLRWFALVLFTLLPALASAQQQGLEIDIIGGNASALPITVVPMPYQGTAAAPALAATHRLTASLETSAARTPALHCHHRHAASCRCSR